VSGVVVEDGQGQPRGVAEDDRVVDGEAAYALTHSAGCGKEGEPRVTAHALPPAEVVVGHLQLECGDVGLADFASGFGLHEVGAAWGPGSGIKFVSHAGCCRDAPEGVESCALHVEGIGPAKGIGDPGLEPIPVGALFALWALGEEPQI
jgi:hypothetical protein